MAITMRGKIDTFNEPEIDLISLAKAVWKERLTVFVSVAICVIIGLVVVLYSTKSYTVSTMIVPQTSNNDNYSINSLMGLNLNFNETDPGLQPILYPQIVNSVPFKLELMSIPIMFEGFDSAVSLYKYYTKGKKRWSLESESEYQDEALLREYTSTDTDGVHIPIRMTKGEEMVCKRLNKMISLVYNSTDDYLTLTVTGPEAIATAQLAQHAQELLQQGIINLKIEKSEAELCFIQSRYDEVKNELERLQVQVARFNDRSKDLINSYSQIEQLRIQNKHDITNSVFLTLADELEKAKLKVKKDTPVFSVIQPVVIPTERTWPYRIAIIGLAVALGLVTGVFIIVFRRVLLAWKVRWNNNSSIII